MTRPITVLLADDHPLMLAGVKQLFEGDEFDVVGEASSGARAQTLIAELAPKVAVLDIGLPDVNGIELVRRIAEAALPTWTIMLSVHDERSYVQQALAAGARGYVLKRSAGHHLLHATRAVSTGGMYLDPTIAGRHLAPMTPKRSQQAGQIRVPSSTLTDREIEIVRLIAFGFTGKEISSRLAITTKSVETYKARACEKLGVSSRAKLVQYAVLQGWLQDLPD